MELPVQITFRHMEPSEAVSARIRQETEKLDTFFPRITSCRVVVEAPHRHHKWGDLYCVRIGLGVPGGELVVHHEPSLPGAGRRGDAASWHRHLEPIPRHKDIYVAISDSFRAVRRQLQDYVRKLRGDVKTHESAPGKPGAGRKASVP